MSILKALTKNQLIFIFLSSLLFIYLIFRAIFVPLVHDEVATFYHFIHTGRFLPFDAHWDANNHMLNSFLSIVFYQIFGNSEFVIRLPNILAFPVYAYFIYRISQKLEGKLLRWAFIIAMLFAHGFTEFFAYTRGYGISMALLAGAIWYLIQSLETNKGKYYALSLIFIALGQFANLTLVNSAIIIIILLFFKIILMAGREETVQSGFKALLVFNMGILPLIFFSYISFIYQDKGLLYYGASTGFWNITVNTQLGFIFSLKPAISSVAVLILSIIALLIFLRLLLRKDQFKNLDNIHFIFFYLFAASLISIFMLNWIFNVNFPEDRTGMYLYFYFPGALIFLIDKIKFKSHVLVLILLLPFLLIPLDFLCSANFIKAAVWPQDRIPPRYYDTVNKFYVKGEYPPTIGGYHLRNFCWTYLSFKDDGHMTRVFGDSYPGLETDFQIAKAEEIPSWESFYDSLDYDRSSGLYLLKRKEPVSKKHLYSSGIKSFEPDTINWLSLYQRHCNDLVGTTLFFELDIMLHSDAKPFRAWMVAEVLNWDQKTVRYEFLALDWLRSDWSGQNGHLKNVMFIHEIPADARTLKVYLWNIDEVLYEIKSSQVEIYEVVRDYTLSSEAEQN